ncbi:STAS domain-containing protein [Actinokineospora sp. NPDC004072]
MSTLLTLGRADHDAAVVVTAEGEVDLATAPQLAAALALAAEDTDHLLVADLSKLRFLGSAGLAVLVTAGSETATTGRSLVVVAGPDCVARRALELTGLDRVLTVVDDEPSALTPKTPNP